MSSPAPRLSGHGRLGSHLSSHLSGWLSGWLGDPRGLTVPGAALVALCLGLAGAGIDAATGTGLRATFAVTFVLGCAVGAALVHHEDLLATVVMPPLLLVALAAAGSILDGGGLAGGWFTRRALDVVTAVVTDAPVLFVALGAVLAVVAVRLVRYRASVRHRRRASRAAGRPTTST